MREQDTSLRRSAALTLIIARAGDASTIRRQGIAADGRSKQNQSFQMNSWALWCFQFFAMSVLRRETSNLVSRMRLQLTSRLQKK
jgi:hypothetical protein